MKTYRIEDNQAVARTETRALMLADRRLKEVQESGAGNTSRSENDIGKGARGPQPPGEEASRGLQNQRA
eukprot:jgi/Mesen1/7582/ME000392S06846